MQVGYFDSHEHTQLVDVELYHVTQLVLYRLTHLGIVSFKQHYKV